MTFLGMVVAALLLSLGGLVVVFLIRFLKARERTAKALEDIANRASSTPRPD